jgi:hypothetical protein
MARIAAECAANFGVGKRLKNRSKLLESIREHSTMCQPSYRVSKELFFKSLPTLFVVGQAFGVYLFNQVPDVSILQVINAMCLEVLKRVDRMS